MFECDRNSIPQPYIKDSDTYLSKAEKFLFDKEYDIAGNFLRKEAEAFCKDFLPKKYHYTSEYNLHDLNGLILQAKVFAENAGLDVALFVELDNHRKFVLNPTSHDSYDVPKFNSEIGSCLFTLKELRKIKNEVFLKRGEEVEFELSDGTDKYKFEIKLEDDFRLLQEPGKDSVVSKGMINYWVTKNTDPKGQTQHGNDSIKAFYNKNYIKSNKVKNADFWQEVIVSESGEALSVHRIF